METALKVLEWVLDNHVSLLSLIVGVVGLIKHFKAKDEAHKLETAKQKAKAIQEVIPACVRVVEDIAEISGNEKVQAFIDRVVKAMKAMGFELDEAELEGIAILGSGEHKQNQDWQDSIAKRKVKL